MPETKIGKKVVGDGHPTYVILEIARTYASLEEAAKMIEIAAANSVDAIKIQSILASELMVKNDNTKDYVSMLEGLERSYEDHRFLKSKCDQFGIDFLSTPEGPTMANLLSELGVDAYKVSSLNLIYSDLLNELASSGKPVIVSTGMGTSEEIEEAVELFQSKPSDLILLHCSSLYPTAPENANLNNISFLKKKYGNTVVGYSDHTVGPLASIAAVSLGANVIEKHFSLDRTQDGADHHVAVDEKMLTEMMVGIRSVEKMLGFKKRELCKEELDMRIFKRRKIIAALNMKKGEVVSDLSKIKMLQTKSRDGIEINKANSVLGRKLNKDVAADHIFSWEDFDE